MTQDQFMGQLRLLLPSIGAILIALKVITPDQWGAWTSLILLIAGPLFVIGGVVWSWIANSKTSIIAAATKMPEVDSQTLAAAISDPALKRVARNGTTS